MIPILDWLPSYRKTWLRGDISAGLTVGVLLIPQGMAYAMIAGLPPIYGLYASTIPLILYALLGTSRQLAVGPSAMIALLTAAGIGALAESGSANYIVLAISLAFLVGAIQFLLGCFRLGFLVTLLSHPVISGFTSAAALIIGLSQLKHLLGIQVSGSHYVHIIMADVFRQLGDVHLLTFILGLGGIVLILGLKKINRTIPGPLIAVLIGILIVWGLGLADNGVTILGTIPEGLPAFGVPDFSLSVLRSLLPTALAISLVSFMESIAVAKALQARHKDYRVKPNQELIALGAANIGGAFFQSFPVTGGFSRTAVNDQAGAKSGVASIISACLILLTLLFLTSLFFYLPNAILASVIMVAVFGLIDLKVVAHLWRTNKSDFVMLMATFISTLILGIELGIGIGVLLSLAVIMYKTTRPHIAILGRVPGTTFYRNIQRFAQVENRPDLLILRFDDQLYFANINYFQEKLEYFISRKGSELKTLIINAESISNIDSTAIQALDDFVNDLRNEGLNVYFTGVIGPVRDAMAKARFMRRIGARNFFMSVQEAVDCHDKLHPLEDPRHREFTLQNNTDTFDDES